MSQQILILSGKKQSGKNTSCNFLHGYVMRLVGSTRAFNVDEKGRLLVASEHMNAQGEKEVGMGILDIERRDHDFYDWASVKMWPFVKAYSFAEQLKIAVINIFGLTYEQCFGTDDDKNSDTTIKWGDVAFTLPPRTRGEMKKSGKLEEFMTAREFMQHFGTDVCRKIAGDCWVDACFRKIQAENVPLAIITDGRFPNEMEAAERYNAKTIRLARAPHQDDHPSETALDDWEPKDFDLFLDNSEMSIQEQNDAVLAQMMEWGIFPSEVAEPAGV